MGALVDDRGRAGTAGADRAAAADGHGNVEIAARVVVSLPTVTSLRELDHFVPLELGGANDIRNLWPEPSDKPGHGVENTNDKVENDLHAPFAAAECPSPTRSKPSPQTGIPPSNTSV